VLGATDTFYADVLQFLKAWSAAPPKLRQAGPIPPGAEQTKPHSLSSTEYSSQDGTEAVDPRAATAASPASDNAFGSDAEPTAPTAATD